MAKENESQQLLQYHLKCLNDSDISRTDARIKRLQFLQQNGILKTVLPEGVVEQHVVSNVHANSSVPSTNLSPQTQSYSKQRNSLPEVDTQNSNHPKSSETHIVPGRRTGPGPGPERDPRKEIRCFEYD